MCIYLSMSIEHDFIWSTTFCVSACICAHHCIMRQAACQRESHQFQFQLSLWVARLVTTREPGAYCPQNVLTVFLFVGFKSVRYVLQLYGAWYKVAYLHLVYNLCTLHDYECNQIVFILNTSSASIYTQYKFSQYLYSVQVHLLFIGINISSIQLQLFFLALTCWAL